jgi:hypothetical protein
MTEENNTIDNTVCPEEETCAEELKLPGMLDMAKNLMRDGTNIVSNALIGNRTLVEDSLRETRWSICKNCPKLLNDRCTECGCFMKVKVAFVTSKCPLEKW